MEHTNNDNIENDHFWRSCGEFKNISACEIRKFIEKSNRSSTLFPIWTRDNSKVIISWLNYWIKKHNNKVIIIFTARNSQGEILGSAWRPVIDYRSNNFDPFAAGWFSKEGQGFCGSIEIEVFSRTPPVYNYPAISLFYENSISSSVVHSCMRSYNSEEKPIDYAISFPQTGFDLNLNDGYDSYICFFGGDRQEYNLNLILKVDDARLIGRELKIKNIRYGALHVVYIKELFGELQGKKLNRLSISHDLDLFPRFYVGIIGSNGAVPTLTHTFPDTTEEIFLKSGIESSAYKTKNNDLDYYSATMIVPILPRDLYLTELRAYGQNLKYDGDVDVKILDVSGYILYKERISEKGKLSEFEAGIIGLDQFLVASGLNESETYYAQFGFRANNGLMPSRFKLGLNIKNRRNSLGANICFAPLVKNENTLQKPITRRWFPIGGSKGYAGYIHMTDFKISQIEETHNLEMEIINFKGEMLKRLINVNSNGSAVICPSLDQEVNNFLSNQIGWCMATSNRYMLDSYFISSKGDQIGADHSF